MNLDQHPVIRHITSSYPLDIEEKEVINNVFIAKTYKRNVSIFDAGETLDLMYFIAEGLLKLVFLDENGKEFILGFAMEDWWESDLGSFFYNNKTTVSLVTMEATTVYSISKADFDFVQERIPPLKSFFLEKSIAGSFAAQQRILSLLSMDVQTRYNHLLQHYPQWFQRIPKKYIATYLGVSRETLSRLIKK